MAATANPPTKAVTEWCKVFHAQGTENYTSSVTFMKQLSVVAISIITYMKNAFPEDCYTVETFAGLKLKILKNKCNDELAQFLSSALTQAFDALDKKYLHQLALCFYEDECTEDNLMEYHIFEYTYNSDGVTMNVHSKNRNDQKSSWKCTFEDIKNQTTQLIRACIVMMQACQTELPETADVSLRLYYNDAAPEGYQAPGYRSDSRDHLASTRALEVVLGRVQTPHHLLRASSYLRDALTDSRKAIPSQNTPTLTQQVDLSESVARSVSDTSEVQLRCPCNKYDDLNTQDPPLLITCIYCGTSQHLACFGLTSSLAAARHCCELCAGPQRPSTDPRLDELSHRKRECLCIFRRTLEWCTRRQYVDGGSLADRFGISAVNAAKLMRLLHSYGIVQMDADSDMVTPKKIYTEPLQQQMRKYFQHEENDLADRLLAETFGSQESRESERHTVRTDPLGDVLTPLEKITLHNTCHIGRVVENQQLTAMETEDKTLKEYREAILSSTPTVIEELPLSGSHVGPDVKDDAKRTTKRKIAEPAEVKHDKRLRTGVRNKKVKS